MLQNARSYNFTFNYKGRPCRYGCNICHEACGAVIYLCVLIIVSQIRLDHCSVGMNNADCFLWNKTVIKSKHDAKNYYSNSFYLTDIHVDNILKETTQKAKKICSTEDINDPCVYDYTSHAYSKQVIYEARNNTELMEYHFQKCKRFQNSGHDVVVYYFWLLFRVLYLGILFGYVLSRFEYYNPGSIATIRKKYINMKKILVKKCYRIFAGTPHKVIEISKKVKRFVCKCFVHEFDENEIDEEDTKTREKLPFRFPPIVIIAVVVVTVGLLAVLITYWTWYETSVGKLLIGCVSPALRNAHSVAIDPATKNSSMLLRGIFKDCTYFIDVEEMEDKFYKRQQAFYNKFNNEIDMSIRNTTKSINEGINHTKQTIYAHVPKNKVDALRNMATRQSDLAYPGLLDRMFSPAHLGVANNFVTTIFDQVSDTVAKYADSSFLLVKSMLANEIVGRLILGDIVTIILQIYSWFGRITLVLCILLRVSRK